MNEDLESFLQLVMEHQMPPKERTIFSLGGRGYYENAASDMLAFFLRPNEEHGFGALFLSAFFECMGVNENAIPELTGANVEREQKTKQGNRIDLQITGGKWCLIVENKIWHSPNNPFEDYEEHAKTLGEYTYFAILSPNGNSERDGRWKGIKYADYCVILRRHFGNVLFDSPHSKWHLFAREFILHVENELYNPTMNTEQANFVEQHEKQIAAAKKLDLEYRMFLQTLLKQTLDETIPGHVFWTKDEKWAIRCYSDKWGRANLAFYKEGEKFQVTAYLVSLTEDQLAKARDKFSGLKFVTEGASWVYWRTIQGFGTRDEAVKEAIRLAAIIADLLQAPPEPGAGVAAQSVAV